MSPEDIKLWKDSRSNSVGWLRRQSREEADQTLVRLNAQRVLHEIAGPWVVAWALVMTLLFAAVAWQCG